MPNTFHAVSCHCQNLHRERNASKLVWRCGADKGEEVSQHIPLEHEPDPLLEILELLDPPPFTSCRTGEATCPKNVNQKVK